MARCDSVIAITTRVRCRAYLTVSAEGNAMVLGDDEDVYIDIGRGLIAVGLFTRAEPSQLTESASAAVPPVTPPIEPPAEPVRKR